MKKIICICMSTIMILSLAACGISEQVEKVEDKIMTDLEDVMSNDLNVDGIIDDSDKETMSFSTSTEKDMTSENTELAVVPTVEPTPVPTLEPTEEPTVEPTEAPTPAPTEIPTPKLTENPTPNPTQHPIPQPTNNPIEVLTPAPTPIPTVIPTDVPTETPSTTPIPSIEPVETSAPVVCEHKNVEQHYDYWGPPTCRQGSTLYTCCIDCEECLYWEHFPPLPHEPDEEYWNEHNSCKYEIGTGAIVQVRCKNCEKLLENRPVTATHNYVPTRIYQEVLTWDYSAEGGSVSQTGYDIQEYECTICGETYRDTIKEYLIRDGEWIEY